MDELLIGAIGNQTRGNYFVYARSSFIWLKFNDNPASHTRYPGLATSSGKIQLILPRYTAEGQYPCCSDRHMLWLGYPISQLAAFDRRHVKDMPRAWLSHFATQVAASNLPGFSSAMVEIYQPVSHSLTNTLQSIVEFLTEGRTPCDLLSVFVPPAMLSQHPPLSSPQFQTGQLYLAPSRDSRLEARRPRADGIYRPRVRAGRGALRGPAWGNPSRR